MSEEESGARRLDGRRCAGQIRKEVYQRVAKLSFKPQLAVIRVGENPASIVYLGAKRRACERVGLRSQEHVLEEEATAEELFALLDALNEADDVDGILLQLPLPGHLDASQFLERIDPAKDVDGLHPANLGQVQSGSRGDYLKPCTPLGVVELLKRNEIELSGLDVVVIGRSRLVGRPLASMLVSEDCTVTLCHSRTRDLAEKVGRADLVVAAVGVPELVKGEWLKPGAVVIDVGLSRAADGRLLGDVDFESALPVASAITPVPGGVGPMTVAMLVWQTMQAALWRRKMDEA